MPPAAWAPLTAFAAALVSVWWLSRGALSTAALDRPNERSLHETPVPRTGGIGILIGVALACPLVASAFPATLWIGLVLVLAVSLLDDFRGAPAAVRFCAHIAAGALIAADALPDGTGVLTVGAVVFAIAWMTNLYNFMDGSDGLAGGMALFGFTAYGAAAWMADSAPMMTLSLSVAAAAAGFLCFNFHPARIFMGDAGSVPLGFLAAGLGLLGVLQSLWPWWFPLLVFSPFIADASVTLARRSARGERVWHAHREHYYQRLVRMGWGHRRTALAAYALMAVAALTAIVSLSAESRVTAALLGAAAAVYLILFGAIDIAWRRRGDAAR